MFESQGGRWTLRGCSFLVQTFTKIRVIAIRFLKLLQVSKQKVIGEILKK